MRERQVEKHAQVGREAFVATMVQREPREAQGETISGEHMRRASKYVARDLIEQKYKGQQSSRGLCPVRQISMRRLHVIRQESVTESLIKGGIGREPLRHAGCFPMSDDCADPDGIAGRDFRHLSAPSA